MIRPIAIFAVAAFTATALPCTIFVVARGGQVLVAANEDMTNAAPYDKHWVGFNPAKNTGELGFITFGYNAIPFTAQGGMNEAGLFFDYNALPNQDIGNGKPKANIFLGEKILAQCKTVNEALKMIEQVDWAALSSGQMVIGDATGDSAIVERMAVTRRGKLDYQIGTNFRTSTTPKSEITCWRYKKCGATLSAGKPVTLESVRQSMEATMPDTTDSKTWYTTICDLKAAQVLLFRKGDFKQVVKLDVKAELAQGQRRIDMDELMAKQGTSYRK